MKNKSLNVLFWIGGDKDPSPRFRFLQFIDSFKNKGVNIGVVKSFPSRFRENKFKTGLLCKIEILVILLVRLIQVFWVSLFKAWKYDLIFTNKDIFPNLNIFLAERILSLFNKKLVFDIDDAIYLGPRGKKLDIIWKYYKYVVAGSPVHIKFINSNYPHLKCYYVPMAIDIKKYQPLIQRKEGKIRIGWSGSHHTNVYALPLLKPIMEELSLKLDYEFIIISNKNPEIKWKNVDSKFIQWHPLSEANDLQLIDIGLMPLQNNPFESGKCSLKALQYMGIGIPALVSPVGVNSSIVEDGINGYHCFDNNEFVENIFMLANDEKLRNLIGKNARNKIVSKHSIDVLTDKYIKIFKEISNE